MIAIRADCNSEIGMGHVMRCLSIADSLKTLGEEVCFIVSKDTDVSSFSNIPYKYIVLENDSDIWSAIEVCNILKRENITKLFLDTYRITEEKLNELSSCLKVYYLDDLHLFDYNVYTVVNYNIEAKESDYTPTQYSDRKLFIGVNYFPLRREFKNVGKTVIKQNVEKVLITTGSTDKNKIIKQILNSIDIEKYSEINFYILKGKFYNDEYKSEIDEIGKINQNIHVLEWGQNMVELYLSSDLVIAPGSTTIFEALSLNIPCVSFEFVDNHHDQCICMENMGIAPYIGNFAVNDDKKLKINEVFEKMLDYKKRKSCEKKYSSLFDGKGSLRIAEIIIGNKGY